MEKLINNQIYQGFRLDEIQRVDEIESTLYRFTHIKTSASVIFSDRKDDNKSFAIAFKTLPSDDTGVFHILEHSLFCGSQKYPVKDPFVRMLQTSMQTFLNALTYPDKTVFPISSRNDLDFHNLMDVYLDAVFHPAFLNNPNVFYQEGYHYEVDEEGIPYVQGIVYSEMQGVFSELDGQIEASINRAVFNGTPYQYISGGHPNAIPLLTYEQFKQTYYKFYTPTNATICLDGSIDLLPTLAYLNDILLNTDYQNQYTYSIPLQKDFTPVHQREYYGVSENETGRKDTLVYTRITKSYDQIKDNLAISLLCDYLCETNESPLKRALLDSGKCEDVRLYSNDDAIQSTLVLEIRGSLEEDFEDLKDIIQTSIRDILEKGIDKSELEAKLAQMSFILKNHSSHYGLGVIFKILQSYTYGGDMTIHLRINKLITELLEDLKGDMLEKLLVDIFDMNQLSEIRLIAKPGLFIENQKAQYNKMCEYSKEIKEEGIKELEAIADNLLKWQEKDDSLLAEECLPVLSLKDVDPTSPIIEPVVKKSQYTFMNIPSLNPDITYARMYFPIKKEIGNNLFELSLLTNLLTNLPTDSLSITSLQKEISKTIGNISFDILTIDQEEKQCLSYFVIELGILNEKVENALKLITNILLSTQLNDHDRVLELLRQIYNSLEQSLSSNGHSFASIRAQSSTSPSGAIKEMISGYTFMNNLKVLIDHFDEQFIELSQNLNMVKNELFTKQDVVVSVTGDECEVLFDEFINALPSSLNRALSLTVFKEKAIKEGISIVGDVAYASLVLHMHNQASAIAYLSAHLVSYEYLWNEIRVQNGAYGAGMTIKETGEVIFYSYRDPYPQNSLIVFDNTNQWLYNVGKENPDLDSIKISTINELDPILTATQKLKIVADGYLTGRGYAYRAQLRKDLFNVSSKDLTDFAKTLKTFSKDGQICVVANEETLQSIDLEILD